MLPCHKMVLNLTHRAYQMWIFLKFLFQYGNTETLQSLPIWCKEAWMCRLPQQLEQWGKAKQLILMMMILIILIDTNWGVFLKLYPFSVSTADIQRGLKARSLLRTHTAMIKTSSDHQATIKPLLDYLSHFGLFSFFVPHFFLPSSCYLLYSPKADTVARQPAQHNSPALHSVGPCGFNQTVWVCAHLYTEHMWGKVKAMNSFHLISKRQKSLQLPRAASWLEC